MKLLKPIFSSVISVVMLSCAMTHSLQRSTPTADIHLPGNGPVETPEVEEEASIFAPEVTNDNAELDKQIEDLDLSVRSYNCLKRAGIHSVRQLVEFSENDLLNIRNFGAKSIEEVKDKLISIDLNLKL